MQIRDARFVRSAPSWEALPDDGRPELALVGRSNVGKSSLLNLLVGRRALAHASRQPGKTRAFTYYLVNADAEGRGGFYLVDLPGVGFARVAQAERARWQRLIGRYVTERAPLRAVFHLVDSRHPPTRLDEELLALLRGGPVPYVWVLTKTDKLSGNARAARLRATERFLAERGVEVPVVPTSAVRRQGAEELWRWARLLAGLDDT